MARPRRDGTPSRADNKRKLNKLYVRNAAPGTTWDTLAPGLVLRVQPSGHRSFYYVYRCRGRVRWYRIDVAGLAAAVSSTDNMDASFGCVKPCLLAGRCQRAV